MKARHDNSSIESKENFTIKWEPTYILKISENRTFSSSNFNNRFNSNRGGNSNLNNRNTRQARYYSNNNSGNQTFANKDKWRCKTNSVDNSGKTLKYAICWPIYHWFRKYPHRTEEDSERKQ